MVPALKAARCALALVLAVLSASTQAQQGRWVTERAALDAEGEPQPVAVATGASGDALRVYKLRGDTLYLSLRLRPGLERLWQAGCPTLQVDQGAAFSAGQADETCETDANGARLVLGRIKQAKIDSALLRRLMEGTEIVARFRLEGLGYRETRFSLSGSKQALLAVIGPGVDIHGVSP